VKTKPPVIDRVYPPYITIIAHQRHTFPMGFSQNFYTARQFPACLRMNFLIKKAAGDGFVGRIYIGRPLALTLR
jgi:hypothetical protein